MRNQETIKNVGFTIAWFALAIFHTFGRHAS